MLDAGGGHCVKYGDDQLGGRTSIRSLLVCAHLASAKHISCWCPCGWRCNNALVDAIWCGWMLCMFFVCRAVYRDWPTVLVNKWYGLSTTNSSRSIRNIVLCAIVFLLTTKINWLKAHKKHPIIIVGILRYYSVVLCICKWVWICTFAAKYYQMHASAYTHALHDKTVGHENRRSPNASVYTFIYCLMIVVF